MFLKQEFPFSIKGNAVLLRLDQYNFFVEQAYNEVNMCSRVTIYFLNRVSMK